MIDIHMHLIPGVDDGAINLEMAKQMIDMAYQQGVRGIVATPHDSAFRYDAEQVLRNFQLLQNYISAAHPDMQFALGTEVYFDMPFLPDTLHRLGKQKIPSMNGTAFVLSEFSPFAEQAEVRTVLTALIKDGWHPIIAHAERTLYAFSDMRFVREMIDLGCMIQVNAYSLSEEKDNTIRTLAQKLLKNELIHFLGSDAHRTTHRAPKVAKGLEYIRKNCTEEYAERILHKNALALLIRTL